MCEAAAACHNDAPFRASVPTPHNWAATQMRSTCAESEAPRACKRLITTRARPNKAGPLDGTAAVHPRLCCDARHACVWPRPHLHLRLACAQESGSTRAHVGGGGGGDHLRQSNIGATFSSKARASWQSLLAGRPKNPRGACQDALMGAGCLADAGRRALARRTCGTGIDLGRPRLWFPVKCCTTRGRA